MALSTTKPSLRVRAHTVQIANGATTSDVFQADDESLVGIVIPVAHTSATLTIQGSLDGTNFYPLEERDGTVIAITTATTTGFYKLPPGLTDGVPYFRFVSGGAEGALRNITAMMANYKAR